MASCRHEASVMSCSLSWTYSELHDVGKAHHSCCHWLLQIVVRNLQTARLRQLLQSWTITTTALHAWRQLKQQACRTGKQSLLKRALTEYACICLYVFHRFFSKKGREGIPGQRPSNCIPSSLFTAFFNQKQGQGRFSLCPFKNGI